MAGCSGLKKSFLFGVVTSVFQQRLRFRSFDSKLIAFLVFGVVVMTFDPDKPYLMLPVKVQKSYPEVPVLLLPELL